MTTAATSRVTLGAILGTITTTAHTITSTFDAANKSVGMLNKLVSDASDRQNVRSKLDSAIFKATLHQDKAIELTESRRRIDDYIGQSERHRSLYETAFNELATVLDPSTSK